MAVRKKAPVKKKAPVQKKAPVKEKIVKAPAAAKKVSSRPKKQAGTAGKAAGMQRLQTAEGWKRMMLRKRKQK